MSQLNTELKTVPHFQSWVLLWAFAESALGGVMHAVKFPFTGIIVGSIAVICIAMLGYYHPRNPGKILQALGMVLLIKLTLSPYSPWQAYIAVFFQGYSGFLIFRHPSFFKIKTVFFATVCLAESAIQKALISILVYGSSMIEAIDQSASHILLSLGLVTETSFFYGVFSLYVGLYTCMGILLGLWIPQIPVYLLSMREELQAMITMPPVQVPSRKKWIRKGLMTAFVFLFILIFIKWILPDFPVFQLVGFLLRSVFVSLLLVFILGPIVMYYVKKWVSRHSTDYLLINEVMHQIPAFSQKAFSLLHQIHQNYFWGDKIKFYIIGLIFLSINENPQK